MTLFLPGGDALLCPSPVGGAPPAATASAAGAATVNVYFALFDEYGRADQLLDAFGFDVAPFQDAVCSLGSQVVARSHANLPMLISR
jgi:hypothetical protein